MGAQRNQDRGQSWDLHPDHTVSTVRFPPQEPAFCTFRPSVLGHQGTAGLAQKRPGHRRTGQVSLPLHHIWLPSLGGRCRGQPGSQQQREGKAGEGM